MPRGPIGEKHPTDVVGNAVHVVRIGQGEVDNALHAATERRDRRVAVGRCKPLYDGTYQILGPMPDDEEWTFAAGSFVAAQLRTIDSGKELLVAMPLAVSRPG